MRKLSVYLLFFLFVCLVITQSTAGDAAADSVKLVNEGILFFDGLHYDEALRKFSEAARIDEMRGAAGQNQLIDDYAWIASCHQNLGDYEQALVFFNKAKAIAGAAKLKDRTAVILNAIGQVYFHLSQYDKAAACFEEALRIDGGPGSEERIASDYNALGAVYSAWAFYDKALDYYRRALESAIKLEKKDLISSCQSNIGWIYSMQGSYDRALEFFTKALAIDEDLHDETKIALDLLAIGDIHRSRGELNKAATYYEKALSASMALANKEQTATVLYFLGLLNQNLQKYNTALDYYRRALDLDQSLGRAYETAADVRAIGCVHYDAGNYPSAEKYLLDSIRIIEKIRLTATGAVRREYFQSEIETYRWLVSAAIRTNKPDRAFDTVELSSAKYLAEQMDGKSGSTGPGFAGALAYQKKIRPQSVVISLFNTDWDKSALLLFASDTILALEVDKRPFIAGIQKNYGALIDELAAALRAQTATEAGADSDNLAATGRRAFEDIIGFYRYLLSKQELDAEEKAVFTAMASGLYKVFIEPLELHLIGKTDITFMTDGTLSFVPMETLLARDGSFLVENYTISYTQSLTVQELINRRTYAANRTSLLVFGGAVYDERSYERDMIRSEGQFKMLQEEVLLAATRGGNLRGAYDALGIGGWGNLPGTLAEARAVGGITNGGKIFTGRDVTEENIKSLSKNGILKNYRVIHFATHALVVPEIPELSAVVLSQLKQTTHEDGYLTMKEISSLDINADFVNLSACETGLGKIYGGEGVVGLTQAFLIAGANGISVSLWQVADESTMLFMTEFYALANNKGLSYKEALSKIKRRFIKRQNAGGADYTNPFFWAPFVYYGK